MADLEVRPNSGGIRNNEQQRQLQEGVATGSGSAAQGRASGSSNVDPGRQDQYHRATPRQRLQRNRLQQGMGATGNSATHVAPTHPHETGPARPAPVEGGSIRDLMPRKP
jgi:hypothetical protein